MLAEAAAVAASSEEEVEVSLLVRSSFALTALNDLANAVWLGRRRGAHARSQLSGDFPQRLVNAAALDFEGRSTLQRAYGQHTLDCREQGQETQEKKKGGSARSCDFGWFHVKESLTTRRSM